MLYCHYYLNIAFSAAIIQETADNAVESNKKITILINVEQPDIILVEKMDDINCLALILNVS